MPAKSRTKKAATLKKKTANLEDIMEDVESEELKDGVDPADDDFDDRDYVAEATHESESDDPDDPDEPPKVQQTYVYFGFDWIQGWPGKTQGGFYHPVLTGFSHLKKPNKTRLKWEKSKICVFLVKFLQFVGFQLILSSILS